MLKPESVLKYETHKILWYFEIQTDHQIWSRQTVFVIIMKKKKRKRKQREVVIKCILLSQRTSERKIKES